MLRAPWLSPEQLVLVQWRRLRRLLDHACARSPLWRERFAALGALPGDLRGVADLALLPVTTREELRAPDHLLAEGFARDRLRTATTSGSTGRRTTRETASVSSESTDATPGLAAKPWNADPRYDTTRRARRTSARLSIDPTLRAKAPSRTSDGHRRKA